MRIHKLQARNLFGTPETPHFHAFRLALLSAAGYQAVQGKPVFDYEENRGYVQLTSQFWPDEHLVCPQVHTLITMRTKDRIQGTPGFLKMETQYTVLRHRRQPVTTIIELPDDLLGVELFNPEPRQSTYTGLFWNLTPGEVHGNLYDPFTLLCSAYAHVESPLFNSYSQSDLDAQSRNAAAA